MARQFDEKYTTNELMMEFYERERPKMNLLSCPLDGMNAERQRLITGLREVLDIDKLKELLPGPLTYNKECEFVTFGVTTEKYCVNMADALNVPVYKLIPEQPNGRTVLYLHGHDNEGVMGAIMERYDKVRYHKNLPVLLAKEGFTVFAPELLGFGESDYLDFPEGKKPRGGCAAHVAFLTVCGYNLTGFRVFETMRVLDMMEQTGVDMPCIGFGVSGGGQVGEYLGVLDERIGALGLSSYPNLFLHSILHKEQCSDNYVSGMLRVGESHEILAAFAPKPLLVSNGRGDRAFTLKGSEIAFPFLEQVYARMGCAENITTNIFLGGHEINADIVLDWFRTQR